MAWFHDAFEAPFPKTVTCRRKGCGRKKSVAQALRDKPAVAPYASWLCGPRDGDKHENRLAVEGEGMLHSTSMGINDVLRALVGVEMEPACPRCERPADRCSKHRRKAVA